ncbi:MAG: AbrB/MazE/SpoVT family DNA-binding domain-containing protein [Dehalococcoidia bacterium]
MKARARLGTRGRLVIPAAIRRQLDLCEGEPLVIEVQDRTLVVSSPLAGLRRAQAIAAKYKRPGVSVVDEFIAEKRAEAARE